MQKNRKIIEPPLAMLLGIAAGFIFIITAFVGYTGELDATGVMYIAVGVCLIVCFVPIYGGSKDKKSCTKNREEV